MSGRDEEGRGVDAPNLRLRSQAEAALGNARLRARLGADTDPELVGFRYLMARQRYQEAYGRAPTLEEELAIELSILGLLGAPPEACTLPRLSDRDVAVAVVGLERVLGGKVDAALLLRRVREAEVADPAPAELRAELAGQIGLGLLLTAARQVPSREVLFARIALCIGGMLPSYVVIPAGGRLPGRAQVNPWA